MASTEVVTHKPHRTRSMLNAHLNMFFFNFFVKFKKNYRLDIYVSSVCMPVVFDMDACKHLLAFCSQPYSDVTAHLHDNTNKPFVV